MDEELIPERHFDARTQTLQSKEPGTIIKSVRKFGVEIEMFHKTRKNIVQLAGLLPRTFGLEHDGSIDAGGGGHGIEVVTPVLKGVKGENAVVETFKTINELGFKINKTCGLHVHLDGEGFGKGKQTLITPFGSIDSEHGIGTVNEKNGDYAFIVKRDVLNTLMDRVNSEDAAQIIADEYLTSTNEYLYLSKEMGMTIPEIRRRGAIVKQGDEKTILDMFEFTDTELEEDTAMKGQVVTARVPEPDDYLCIVYGNKNLKNVLTLLYLHTVYSDVFLSMLPMSRRQDNLYCQSLSLGFSAAQIEAIRSYTELEAAWYKTRTVNESRQRKGNHYDDSRYFTMNLHSLFAKYGTIEFRAHTATLDHNKVLYWVAFNQEILDRIVSGEINMDILRQGINIFNPDERVEFVKDVLGLRPSLTKYMQKRIDYFKNNPK